MSIKDIWNSIINYDLTNLLSEQIVFPITIFATMLAYYLIWISLDEDNPIKVCWKKVDNNELLPQWWALPFRWLFNLLILFVFLYLLLLPVVIVDMWLF